MHNPINGHQRQQEPYKSQQNLELAGAGAEMIKGAGRPVRSIRAVNQVFGDYVTPNDISAPGKRAFPAMPTAGHFISD